MPTKNVYFETNGVAWNNLAVNGQGSVTGNALILNNASSANLVLDLGLAPTSIVSGQFCSSLDTVTLTFPDGTKETLYSAAYGCGTYPIMCGCPGNLKKTIALSNYSQYEGQSITLHADSFGFSLGANGNNWSLTAYIAEDIPQTSATMDITVVAGGTPLANALIAVTDNTTNQTFSLTTDASGQATLTGINVGDSITLAVSESGYSTVNETVSVYYQTSDVTITLVASTTGQITNIFRYVAIAGGVVLGGAAVYEVAKAVSEKEARPEFVLPTK